MGDLRLVLIQAGYGLRTLARNPRVIVFSVLFPVVLLVLFNASSRTATPPRCSSNGSSISADAYFTAGIIAYAIMLSAFSTLAIGLTTQRESGQLKRLRGTPLPSWTFIAAQVLRSIVLVAVMVIVLLLIGHFAFDVPIPGTRMVGFVIYVVLGTATFAALGVALTVVTPTAEAASTIAPFGTVMLAFISGRVHPGRDAAQLAGGDRAGLPAGPPGPGAADLLGDRAAAPACPPQRRGAGPVGIGGGVAAARNFRWEPQAARG